MGLICLKLAVVKRNTDFAKSCYHCFNSGIGSQLNHYVQLNIFVLKRNRVSILNFMALSLQINGAQNCKNKNCLSKS